MAFIGFRHAHGLGLYKLACQNDGVEVVAACEEDAPTRAQVAQHGIGITHDSYTRMLEEVDCDVIACADYYRVRGERLIQAMERGKHVIADKPLCITLGELDRIAELSAHRTLRVGCMLDLPDLGPYIALRRLIQEGRIGEVHAITFLGQHPLLYGTRPLWMLEEGKHGGSINDIAIHALDIIPWLTGRRILGITAARAWNAKVKTHPWFQDGAMLMLQLDNGGGVLGDVSYLSSDKHGYTMPPYWRFTLAGTDGVAETSCNDSCVSLWRHDAEEVIKEPVSENNPGGYFRDFLADLAGAPNAAGRHTQRVLESSRAALLAQQAADTATFPINL